jgi:tetratricopeptide (TPR) repeat protein
VRTLRSQSLETQDRKEAARLSLLVAKLFARFDPAARGKVDEALDRAFLHYPGMPEAAAFVEALCAQDPTNPARAAARLEELAARTQEKTAQADLWIRAGTQRLSRLSDPPRALEDFRLAHLADPSRADAASLAVELAIELGNPAAAAELLEAHLRALGDPAQTVSARKQLAALYAGALKTPARALAHLEAALAAAPGELALALKATELALEVSDAQALGRLLPLLELPGPWKKAATELLERCAAVFEGANDPDRAADALARALLHSPSRVELLPRLVDDGRRASSESLAALAAALRRAAGMAPEPTAAAAVWRALAQLLQLAPERAAEAKAAWREVALREPASAPPAEPATPTPAQLQAELATLGPDPKPHDALPLWRQLFAASPEDTGVARQLAGVLAALERWEELAEVTSGLAKIAPTPEERLDFSVRLARLYADPLGKPEQAATVLLERVQAGELGAGVVEELQRIASRGVRREEIQAALSPHYQRSSAHQKEVAELLHALGAARKPGKQKKALLQLADLHEGPLEDTSAALGYLLRALAVAPTDAPLAERSWQLAAKLGRLPELGRTLADAGEQQSDRAGKAALYARAADAALEGGELEEAARWADLSLKAKETARALDLALQLGLRRARPEEAERHLRRRLLLAEGPEKRGLYLQLAELSEKLGRPADAATALEEAVRAGES